VATRAIACSDVGRGLGNFPPVCERTHSARSAASLAGSLVARPSRRFLEQQSRDSLFSEPQQDRGGREIDPGDRFPDEAHEPQQQRFPCGQHAHCRSRRVHGRGGRAESASHRFRNAKSATQKPARPQAAGWACHVERASRVVRGAVMLRRRLARLVGPDGGGVWMWRRE